MAQYLKIPSPTGGSCNRNLKKVIRYIGMHYGKLANKKDLEEDEYYVSGLNFIAKRFGSFQKNAIRLMVEPNRIKKSKNRQWCFNKRIYVKAYYYITKLLRKRLPIDEVYITDLFKILYQNIYFVINTDSNLNCLCSDALLHWQKGMLALHEVNSNVSENDRDKAGEILRKIEKVDKFGGILMKSAASIKHHSSDNFTHGVQ